MRIPFNFLQIFFISHELTNVYGDKYQLTERLRANIFRLDTGCFRTYTMSDYWQQDYLLVISLCTIICVLAMFFLNLCFFLINICLTCFGHWRVWAKGKKKNNRARPKFLRLNKRNFER
ncbi:hypothetical protein SNEBB_006008 [Seison nebaliae]|nr:hypothetical protein SNEBB_006008 [Seison nebaliae]